MINEFVKRVLCLLMAVITSFMLIACGAETELKESMEQPIIDQMSVNNAEITETTTPRLRGNFALADCLTQNGVFIGYEDGSYVRFPGSGWCRGVGDYYDNGFIGMYFNNSVLEDLVPTVDSNTKVIVCSDQEYSLSVHAIHAEVPVITVDSPENGRGYGRIDQAINEAGARVKVWYENGESEIIWAEEINGKPAIEYPYDTIELRFRPYKGASQTVKYYILHGFKKADTITFGTVEGTKCVETTYNLEHTYYHCDPDAADFDAVITYRPEITPTKEGYATVDFSNIPSGKYVMLFRYSNKYKATILNLNND